MAADKKVTIFHNARCSKSREALDLLKDKTLQINVVEYLKTPPTFEELKKLLAKLNLKPEQFVRKSEPLYKTKFAGKKFGDEEWIKIMTENPILIERPIIIRGNKAIIGRPPELVLDLF